jgi:hypothetical protein
MNKTSFIGDLIYDLERTGVPGEMVCAERAKRAPKFRFDADEIFDGGGRFEKFIEFGAQLQEVGLFRLPYEEAVFEIHEIKENPDDFGKMHADGELLVKPGWDRQSMALVAWHVGDDICFRFYFVGLKSSSRGLADFAWSGQSAKDGIGDAATVVDEESREFIAKSGDPDFLKILSSFGILTLLMGVGLLNLGSGIKRQEIPTLKYINSKRKAKGKPLIHGHTLVTIDYESLRVPGAKTGDSHASPKVHWRRGHVRTLPSGQKTLVRACLVGAPSGAEVPIDRHYEVKGLHAVAA